MCYAQTLRLEGPYSRKEKLFDAVSVSSKSSSTGIELNEDQLKLSLFTNPFYCSTIKDHLVPFKDPYCPLNIHWLKTEEVLLFMFCLDRVPM